MILFLAIFLEGYAVLSTELLAIRQIMPFVGSNTEMVAIVIAAVLLPLAVGYATGGNFRPHIDRHGRSRTIRGRLLRNLSLSAIILGPGLSHLGASFFFLPMLENGPVGDKRLLTALYTLLILVGPIYMMGQTVPLVSHYFRRQSLSAFAGKILFFSTFGSFAGSILCTMAFMPYIGVHNTLILTILSLVLLVIILSRHPRNRYVATVLLALGVTMLMNSNPVMRFLSIVADDQYMTVQVSSSRNGAMRVMEINGTYASAIHVDPAMREGNALKNLDYMEKQFIDSLPPDHSPIDILIIGAGGFTFGLHDGKNRYTYIDINPNLQEIAETHFLREKLGPNKKFIPEEARAFLATTKNKYDLVVLDPYQDTSGIPLGLVSVEFFRQIDRALKPGGIMTGNFVVAVNFSDVFSIRLDNTLREVFPNLNRQALWPYNGWQQDKPQYASVIYTAFKTANRTEGVYTDDLNSSSMDKNKKP